jgi:hypothetical protein
MIGFLGFFRYIESRENDKKTFEISSLCFDVAAGVHRGADFARQDAVSFQRTVSDHKTPALVALVPLKSGSGIESDTFGPWVEKRNILDLFLGLTIWAGQNMNIPGRNTGFAFSISKVEKHLYWCPARHNLVCDGLSSLLDASCLETAGISHIGGGIENTPAGTLQRAFRKIGVKLNLQPCSFLE